jgi:hypothetical protein
MEENEYLVPTKTIMNVMTISWMAAFGLLAYTVWRPAPESSASTGLVIGVMIAAALGGLVGLLTTMMSNWLLESIARRRGTLHDSTSEARSRTVLLYSAGVGSIVAALLLLSIVKPG